MKRILRYLLVIALTIVFVALFLRRSDPRSVMAILRSLSPWWLLLAIGADVMALVFRALRWRLILDPERPPRFYHTFFSTAVGYSISMLLPVRAADVVRPVLLSRRTDVRFSTALGTILTERVLDLTSMLTLFMLFVVRYVPEFAARPRMAAKVLALQWAAGVGLAIVSALMALVVSLYFFSSRIRRFHQFIGKILPKRFHGSWMRFFDSFAATIQIVHNRRVFAYILLCTAGLWLCLGSQFYLVLLAFHRPLPFLASFLVTAMAIIGLVIPTPAGVGGYHKASQLALTSFFGFDVNSSVAVALVFHFVGVVPLLVTGLVLSVREGLTWKAVSHLAEEAPADAASEIGETGQE